MTSLGFFRPLTWDHVLVVVAIFLVARLVGALVRRACILAAARAAPQYRLGVLRISPIVRLAIGLTSVLLAIPILVEPTPQNVIALLASAVLALGLGLKDYASSLFAGLTAVVENVYQPGDWIEFAGTYGEVRAITLRTVRLVTADDTEVIIPHSRLWTTRVANATSGNHSLLCVTRFYLQPAHDADAVRHALEQLPAASAQWKQGSAVAVMVEELPWGTAYKLKAYVNDSREQFAFMTDLTVRGKAALVALGARFAQVPYAATA